MKKFGLVFGMLAVGALLTTGCRTPSAGVTVESYPHNKISVNSKLFGGWMTVTEIAAAKKNDLLQAQIAAQNTTTRDCQFEYRFRWLDKNGMEVLSSSHHKFISLTEDFWAARPHTTGMYLSNCTIPENFLNEGMYSITAILGLYPNTTQILEDYVVSFMVHDTGDMRKEFYGGWLGVIRPKLAWSTELIDN